MRLLRFGILVALSSLILTACGGQLSAEAIMDRMQQARDNLQRAHAIADVAVTTPERSGTARIEGWIEKTGETDSGGKPVARMRINVLEASEPELVNAEFVTDGDTFWMYNPGHNTVLTGNQNDLKRNEFGAQDPAMQMLRMQEMLQQILDGSDVTVESQSEDVAGRTTRKVSLRPRAETNEALQLGSLITTYLWIDQQTDLPVKVLIEAGSQGTVEATATTLDLDQPIDTALFQFTPPAGAKVVNAGELARRIQPERTTIDAAREQVSFTLLVPSALPEGVQMEDVQIMRMRGESVIQYYGGEANFSLVQSAGDIPNSDPSGVTGLERQQVDVRGHAAELLTAPGPDGGTFVRWSENGVNIVIAGTLSPEEAIAFAESLE